MFVPRINHSVPTSRRLVAENIYCSITQSHITGAIFVPSVHIKIVLKSMLDFPWGIYKYT